MILAGTHDGPTDGRGTTVRMDPTLKPAIVQILHKHPEVRDSFPIGSIIDEAVRWSA